VHLGKKICCYIIEKCPQKQMQEKNYYQKLEQGQCPRCGKQLGKKISQNIMPRLIVKGKTI
jgi:ssDNA-binding Zn-finger/Zn-ribbon topoisomerase 1